MAASRLITRLGERGRRTFFSLADRAMGARFSQHLKELDRAQNLTPEALKQWQQQRLFDLLCHARDTTRFYSSLVPLGFLPQDSWEILSQLPVIHRDAIDVNADAFLSRQFTSSYLYAGFTSGSVGHSVAFWMDRARRSRILAELAYFGGWAGYEIGDRHMFLRQTMPESTKNSIQLWPKNQILFNTSSLNKAQLDDIVASLISTHTRVLFGYPWTLQVLATHCLHLGRAPATSELRSIIALGGPLSIEARERIEETFQCPVFERYSALELGTIANDCEMHRLHLNVGSLYAEFLSNEGPLPSGNDVPGNVVLTDLFNYGMPLLRYEIGDKAVLDIDSCDCGRTSPIISAVYGRVVDQVTLPDGTWIDPFRIGNLLRDISGLHQFQFVQQTSDAYQVFVILESTLASTALPEIALRFEQLLGSSATLQITQVAGIPALPSGKRPFIVNKMLRSSSSKAGVKQDAHTSLHTNETASPNSE